MSQAQGPIRDAFENILRTRLKAKLVSEGTAPADADQVINDAASAHPLLDLFMQYGLPFIMQLLSNLLALGKPNSPMPLPPAPTPGN